MYQTVVLIVTSGEDLAKVKEEWTSTIYNAIKGGRLRDAFDNNRKYGLENRQADKENQQVLDRLIFESDWNGDDPFPPGIIVVIIFAAASTAGVVAAGTTSSAVAMGTQPRTGIAKLASLWEVYGTLWKGLLTSMYLLYQTSRHLGGNTCFVVINNSPKQLDLIVKENELTVAEKLEISSEFVPPERSGLSWFSFSKTYTKDVTKVIDTIQKIPLPKGMSRKILVRDMDCYITLRSFTKCYDPDSFDSDYMLEYRGMKGYIVHLVDYRLVQRKTKLDDLAQGIIYFHPDPVFKESDPFKLDETYDDDDDDDNDDASHHEAETNFKVPTAVSALVASLEVRTEESIITEESISSDKFYCEVETEERIGTEERISSDEFYFDPPTDLESPPDSSRPLAPVAFPSCQTAIKESNMTQTRVDQFFRKEARAPTAFQEATVESNMVQTTVDQFFRKEVSAPTAFQEA